MTPVPVQCVPPHFLWGIGGICLVSVLLIIVAAGWVLGRHYHILRDYLKDTRTFTSAAIESLRDIKHACDRCLETNVATVKTEVASAMEQILAGMVIEHGATRELIAAIGREEDRTVEAIKGVREAIEHNSELISQVLKPSPVGEVGSQVKESVEAAE